LRENEAAALFDEQGLGKSKQVIDALAGQIADSAVEAAVIVCPNGLKSNWAQEIEKFCALPYAVFGSGRSERRMAFRSLKARIYVINYEAVAAELPSLKSLLRFRSTALVLDESHRIKTPDAKTTQAVLALRGLAARRYILSGTPVANKPEDLWAQMMFLDGGQSLGASFEAFRQQYGRGTGGYRNLDQLRERVSAKSLRRLKEGTLELPGKTYVRVTLPLQGRQAEMYDTLKSELVLWVEAMDGTHVEKNAEAILARLVRLAQIASNPGMLDAAYQEVPAKFEMLDKLLEEYLFRPQQKVLVWSSFVENIELLRLRYARWNPVCIHGAVGVKERDAAVRSFKHDDATRVLIANPAAAREGLTLTEANVAIYVDRTFNLVDYLQSQDRIHRISQRQACEIVLLIAQNTVDEFIDFTIEQKHRLAKYAQEDSAELSTGDIMLLKPAELQELIRTM
jgi:SNF2 family DNA or RNA helicase